MDVQTEKSPGINLPKNWQPSQKKMVKPDELIPFIEAAKSPSEMTKLNDMNNEVVDQLIECDKKLSNLKWLPNAGQEYQNIKKKKRRLMTQHIMLVMAMKGNPHLNVKDKKEREKIIADTMKSI